MDFLIIKGATEYQRKQVTSINPYWATTYVTKKVYDKKTKKYINKKVKQKVLRYNAKGARSSKAEDSPKKYEYAFLRDYTSLDIEIGGSNDFQLVLEKDISASLGIEFGDYIMADDTEWGGIIDDCETDTASDVVTWRGTTWRGMLDKDIIRPSTTQNYYTVSGYGKDIVSNVLLEGTGASQLFTSTPGKLGGTYSKYEFPRYCTKLDGLTGMLEKEGYKLKPKNILGGTLEEAKVTIEVEPIKNLSNEYEMSQDNKININFKENRGGITHLICLGEGELKARQSVDLYLDLNGKIIKSGQGTTYTNASQRTEIFECSNPEGENINKKLEDLIKKGAEKLKELSSKSKMDFKVQGDIDADIGDIISGVDRTTGLTVSRPIVKKILRASNGEEQIEIVVAGEGEGKEEKEIL